MTAHLRRVPVVERPLVSVLMVTYGARAWVERALEALIEHTPPIYELVVVDNGSTDGTREYLRDSIDGARVYESPYNLGFGVGNNLAAMHARGDFLCLLNSDAIVSENWLEPLVQRFDDPRVGAVVPLYLFPDGTLQEAGAVVEADGRVVALGVRDDPATAEWSFARTVSYGSAACMLMRRHVFQALGGFDPAYGTAYYEDVDLAFRLQALGLQVVVEPAVQVVHAQGASSPTHADATARRDANQARFRERWNALLRHRPNMFGAPEPHHFFGARDIEVVDRFLVIAPVLPARGDPLGRCARTIAAALDGGIVTVATFRDSGDQTLRDELLSAGIEVVVVEDWDSWLERRRFHYSAVICEPATRTRLAGALAATQPQATLAPPPAEACLRDDAQVATWLLGLGVVPRLDHPGSRAARRLRSPP
jgi:GT2 family glycosyltransferase